MENQNLNQGHKSILFLIGGLVVGVVLGYVFGNMQGTQAGIAMEKARVDAQKAETAKAAAVQVNPFNTTTVNPYEKASVNPYKDIKVNPFQ